MLIFFVKIGMKLPFTLKNKRRNTNMKGRGGSAAWGGLCLKFYPKCSKFGTIVHLGSKIWGKIK